MPVFTIRGTEAALIQESTSRARSMTLPSRAWSSPSVVDKARWIIDRETKSRARSYHRQHMLDVEEIVTVRLTDVHRTYCSLLDWLDTILSWNLCPTGRMFHQSKPPLKGSLRWRSLRMNKCKAANAQNRTLIQKKFDTVALLHDGRTSNR